MSRNIKGILIDVEKKEIREIELPHGDSMTFLHALHREIKCDCVTSCEGAIFQKIHHACFVDDEGLLKETPLGAFSFGNGRPYAGNAIIVGIGPRGESIGHTLKLEEFRDLVKWRDVKELPKPFMQFIPLP